MAGPAAPLQSSGVRHSAPASTGGHSRAYARHTPAAHVFTVPHGQETPVASSQGWPTPGQSAARAQEGPASQATEKTWHTPLAAQVATAQAPTAAQSESLRQRGAPPSMVETGCKH
jgi:hypothetical protein